MAKRKRDRETKATKTLVKESTERQERECAEKSRRETKITSRLERYRNLAQENVQREKLGAAQRCLEKAVYIAVKTFGPTHLEVGTNLLELAAVLSRRGLTEVAEPLMARARRIFQLSGN